MLVVSVSLAAGYDGYGETKYCWLSYENGMIWAFLGPALASITVSKRVCILLSEKAIKSRVQRMKLWHAVL